MRSSLLAFLLTLSFAVSAVDLPGRVVRVVDGDTLVIEAGDERRKVRLAGIDAPERDQLWGDASTRELRRQVAGRDVVVVWDKADRWDRLIGVIRLDGEGINLHMVDRGMAWHFKRYAREQTPEDRETYSAAEIAAQGARRGLWSDSTPVPLRWSNGLVHPS